MTQDELNKLAEVAGYYIVNGYNNDVPPMEQYDKAIFKTAWRPNVYIAQAFEVLRSVASDWYIVHRDSKHIVVHGFFPSKEKSKEQADWLQFNSGSSESVEEAICKACLQVLKEKKR